MADSDGAQKHLRSQENLLLDYMRRLEEKRGKHGAVRLHLSDLKPYNRREHHLRAAENSFENLVKSLQGQLFSVKNSDMFFFFKNEARPQAQTVVQKVRFLFSDDPLLEDEAPGENLFSTWYDTDDQYEELLQLIESLIESEEKRKKDTRVRMDTRAALKVRQREGDPMTPEILARVESALERTDLSNLVRRQFVCSVDAQMIPEQSFSEMFISIADLRETMIPGVNLLANRWLFQHLTESLDRRMLSLLSKNDALTISGDISFNANVTTLLSRGFQEFDDNISASRRGSMIIELQKVDIFADLGAYLFAREYVQDKGYRVCLDGLTHKTMGMVDRERLGADMVKLVWHSDMVDGGPDMHEKVRTMVKRANPSKVILCRVDTREAIDFGQSVGIRMFQGHFVENLIAEDSRRRELLRLKRRMERSEEAAEIDDDF
ncbi:MAG: EAL domain-containing protein [Rhodospirillaceae bacterium]|nr:EAL domain-containing protein [Rhodospirillaceae bacterium]